jgi:hypothetical protein
MERPRGAPAKRRRKSSASARVSELIHFDEEDHQRHIQEDIEHGVAHTVNAVDELEEHVRDVEGAVWENESLFEDALDELAEGNTSLENCGFQLCDFFPCPEGPGLPGLLALRQRRGVVGGCEED